MVAWVYRSIAGIDEGAPGFKQIVIRPMHDARMTAARGEYESVYGTIVSDWTVTGGAFRHKVVILPNTMATVYLPAVKGPITEAGKQVEVKPVRMGP